MIEGVLTLMSWGWAAIGWIFWLLGWAFLIAVGIGQVGVVVFLLWVAFDAWIKDGIWQLAAIAIAAMAFVALALIFDETGSSSGYGTDHIEVGRSGAYRQD